MFESNKILSTKLNIVATTVRVPISYCHGESVYVKFENEVNLDDIKNGLGCEYIEFTEDIIYPINCIKTNKTFVYRLRQKSSKEIVFFVLANNLRRGAAFNAIEILRRLEQL